MAQLRFVFIVMLAGLLSACGLFQPIRPRTAVDFAEDCITLEAPVAAQSRTMLESAVAHVLRKCDAEIRGADADYLSRTRGDGRSVEQKIAELRYNQHTLAKDLISLARNK